LEQLADQNLSLEVLLKDPRCRKLVLDCAIESISIEDLLRAIVQLG
jgi:hypothetical protein